MIQYYTIIQVVECLQAKKIAEFERAFMCGVRTHLNISQLHPLLGTKAKYVRENTVGISCTRSIYFGFVLLPARSRYGECLKYLGVRYRCGYCKYIKLSISSVGSYCEYSQQYRNTLNMLSNTPSIQMFRIFYPEREEIFILREYFFVCAGFYSAGHKVLPGMSQPRPRTTFFTYVYAASVGLIAASHLCRIKIHSPVHPFL